LVDKLITSIALANGLILELYDGSRRVAGDRWLVCAIARIDIPVDEIGFLTVHPWIPDAAEIKKHLGERVRFEQKRERHFIDERQKEDVLKDIVDSLLSTVQGYLSHPDFAKNVLAREYKKCLTRESWYPDENAGGNA